MPARSPLKGHWLTSSNFAEKLVFRSLKQLSPAFTSRARAMSTPLSPINRVRLDPLHVTGEDTDLRAQGTLALNGTRQLDLAASGSINLKLAETIDPDLTAARKLPPSRWKRMAR